MLKIVAKLIVTQVMHAVFLVRVNGLLNGPLSPAKIFELTGMATHS